MRKFHIVRGLEKAPEALPLLFTGGNTGKLFVPTSSRYQSSALTYWIFPESFTCPAPMRNSESTLCTRTAMKTFLPMRFSGCTSKDSKSDRAPKTYVEVVPPTLQRYSVIELLRRAYIPMSGPNSLSTWQLDDCTASQLTIYVQWLSHIWHTYHAVRLVGTTAYKGFGTTPGATPCTFR
jgi:hypothetical protein